ncbi:uncharacterized protein LOC125684323 isoform X12 [Lagopus muta]|uniref:uncharacterized protein LOC125684323 isoform X11 n=1 Tax=Lagopus muta TaxID=64668 RepID=UPI00209E24DD|nr:uncharacterized protein LOC125684323 isoform X11 [Lagopus muta]XP_048782389.1 uncharacterized protein LOC125684323 isoform X12 [Lagopus muta]
MHSIAKESQARVAAKSRRIQTNSVKSRRVGKQPLPLFGGEKLYVCRLDHVFPRPASSPRRSLQKDQAPRCSGSCPHLCLITAVPAGPLGEVPKRSPVAEPGLDARERGMENWRISAEALPCPEGNGGGEGSTSRGQFPTTDIRKHQQTQQFQVWTPGLTQL